jgi:LysR family hydrogen peroxide-inducible transcriptional activator
MDLRQLAALVAVSEQGTFSAAADSLHTVQSNVSAHIRRLERELGAQLVDRAGCRLTEEGEIVVARARRIQSELDALVADVVALRDHVSGSVRIGVISSTARWLVPLLLRALHERHPDVRAVVVDATTTSLAPQVASGALDLGVMNLPIDEHDLIVSPLFEEDFLLVTPVDHELNGRTRVAMADLDRVPLLLPPTGTGFRAELDAAAGSAGITLMAQAELDGVRLIASMVFQGFGAAVLPASAVTSWRGDSWRATPISGIPARQVGVTQRRRGLPSAPARALLEVLHDVVADDANDQPGIRPAA